MYSECIFSLEEEAHIKDMCRVNGKIDWSMLRSELECTWALKDYVVEILMQKWMMEELS